MIRIVKSGNTSAQKPLLFTCPSCGCEFMTNEYISSYEEEQKIDLDKTKEQPPDNPYGAICVAYYRRLERCNTLCPECHDFCVIRPIEKESPWFEL